MEMVIDIVSWFLLLLGGAVAVVSGYGILRLPDVYARMHAASMLDSLGAMSVFAGLALQSGFNLLTAKLALTYLFLLLTTATAAHILAKSASKAGIVPVQGPQGGTDGSRLAPTREVDG